MLPPVELVRATACCLPLPLLLGGRVSNGVLPVLVLLPGWLPWPCACTDAARRPASTFTGAGAAGSAARPVLLAWWALPFCTTPVAAC